MPLNTLSILPWKSLPSYWWQLAKGDLETSVANAQNESETVVTLFIPPLRDWDNNDFLIEEKIYDYLYDFAFTFACGIAEKNFDEWSDIIL